ncbi:MAG: hypothetical protein A3I78_04565 [Gammaproteobacteria bacterium RIFCSPLOWO2_02_FULL_56_15]|nr:MAG: hypothetical protein A3I78_04565 [Gammaproteobacteria bacterium RIFCSPLOWO2_02_FULL_56_15]
MGGDEISGFLNYLANRENVSASTQNQALSALIFLYKQVLSVDVGELPEFQYARKPRRLPVVLTQEEVKAVFQHLREPHRTIVGLLYGSGLRLNECLGLRILDIDFGRREIMVRRGKGNKDRRTLLPDFVMENGYDIRTVQELLGHAHVNTTMIYTHVLNRGGRGVKSPLDVM